MGYLVIFFVVSMVVQQCHDDRHSQQDKVRAECVESCNSLLDSCYATPTQECLELSKGCLKQCWKEKP